MCVRNAKNGPKWTHEERTQLIQTGLISNICVHMAWCDKAIPSNRTWLKKITIFSKLRLKTMNCVIKNVVDLSTWLNIMSYVPKTGDKLCSLVDMVQLNKILERPMHKIEKTEDASA